MDPSQQKKKKKKKKVKCDQVLGGQKGSIQKLDHAINNEFFQKQNWKFQWKNFIMYNTFTQNMNCGYTSERCCRGSSNEYPESIFWIKNEKNRYSPANHSFTL